MQPVTATLSNVIAYENPLVGQTVGMVVVFAALILIAIVVSLVGKIMVARDKMLKEKEAATFAALAAIPANTPAPQATPAVATQNGLTPELVAVIAAAVDTVLDGQSHRILDIRQSAASAWGLSGRTEIYASHRIR